MAMPSFTIHVEDSEPGFNAFSVRSQDGRLGVVDVASGCHIMGSPKGLEALAEALMEAASAARTAGIVFGETVAVPAAEARQ